MVLSEGTTEKIPSDTTGTVQLVAQRLNHYTTQGPTFAYVNACKSTTLDINLIYLDNKNIYWIFKTCCILCFIFYAMPFIS
jgi:hypothetical protein